MVNRIKSRVTQTVGLTTARAQQVMIVDQRRWSCILVVARFIARVNVSFDAILPMHRLFAVLTIGQSGHPPRVRPNTVSENETQK